MLRLAPIVAFFSALLLSVNIANAQDGSEWRVALDAGVSSGLRLNSQRSFDDDRLLPLSFLIAGAVYLPTDSAFSHGILLSTEMNLVRDGRLSSDINAFSQTTFRLRYSLRYAIDSASPKMTFEGGVGLLASVGKATTWGPELAVRSNYFLTSGIGIFAEVSTFIVGGEFNRNGRPTLHAALGLHLGARLEWELLP